MNKLEQLYEGKAKKVYKTDVEDVLIVDYKDDATAFVKRWHGDIVEYSIASLAGGFGEDYFFETAEGKSRAGHGGAEGRAIRKQRDVYSGKGGKCLQKS